MNAQPLPPVEWEGIVKVQRSLFTTLPTQQVRINNQDESVLFIGDADPGLLRWFEDGEAKFYAKAKLRGGVIHIIRKHTEPRSW